MRIIDADKLMNKYKGRHDFYLNAWDGDFKSMDAKDKARCDELNGCIADIFNAPSIDIVRCGECMHNGSHDTDCPFGWRNEEWNMPKPCDFCSYGERREP